MAEKKEFELDEDFLRDQLLTNLPNSVLEMLY